MAKFYGEIGYAVCIEEDPENHPGVWVNKIIEKNYTGELLKNVGKRDNSGYLNDNINIANQISIIADPYARLNYQKIVYAKFMGTAWRVTSVEVQYPRLVLQLGGIYANGESY